MPDLLLYRHSPVLSAKLVEVKGPRDRLSEAQRAWMRALQHAGACDQLKQHTLRTQQPLRTDVAVEVCKVLEPEAAQRKAQHNGRRRGAL